MEKHALRLLVLALAASAWGSGAGARERGSDRKAAPLGEQVAWDCVPDYSWGYWRWAWQPCAWLDPDHVQHAIAALDAPSQTAQAH